MNEQDFLAILDGENKGCVYKVEIDRLTQNISLEEWQLVEKFGETFTISLKHLHKNGTFDIYQKSLDQFSYHNYFLSKHDAIQSAIKFANIEKDSAIKRIDNLIQRLTKLDNLE